MPTAGICPFLLTAGSHFLAILNLNSPSCLKSTMSLSVKYVEGTEPVVTGSHLLSALFTSSSARTMMKGGGNPLSR